jgi:transposase
MESTGVYWKPIYNTWAPLGLIITLGNAAHLKNVPGRKTDMNDSEWIATLHRSGLIRPSFIPEREYQELRLLTRHRQNLVDDQSRLKNRVQKILEDANIKLSSVMTDVFGVSGLKILRAIAQGITDRDSLAALVCTKIKRPLDVPKAMHNTLTKTQIMIVRDLLRQFDEIQSLITNAESEISSRLQKHHDLLQRLDDVPGINKTIAQTVIAEATTDMSHFKDDRVFAAWAGVAPGNNESASKKKEPEPEKEILP